MTHDMTPSQWPLIVYLHVEENDLYRINGDLEDVVG